MNHNVMLPYTRRSLPERKPPTATANAPNKNKQERLQGILQYRNINIKVRAFKCRDSRYSSACMQGAGYYVW
jgi:hypothetical protein